MIQYYKIIKLPTGYIYEYNKLEINMKKLSEIYQIIIDFKEIIDEFNNKIDELNYSFNLKKLQDIIDNFKTIIILKSSKFFKEDFNFYITNIEIFTEIFSIEQISNVYSYQVDFDRIKSLNLKDITKIFDIFMAQLEEYKCREIDLNNFYNKKELFYIYDEISKILENKGNLFLN